MSKEDDMSKEQNMSGEEGNREMHMEEEGMEGIKGGNLLRKSILLKVEPIMGGNWR